MFAAECSFRNVTGKNQLGIDAVSLASNFWQPKKGQCVMMRAETNRLSLSKSSVTSLLV